MKGPENESKPGEQEPPGGRALERLHQFERERGLEETDISEPKPDQPAQESREEGGEDEEETREREPETPPNTRSEIPGASRSRSAQEEVNDERTR